MADQPINWDEATAELADYFGDDVKPALQRFGEKVLGAMQPKEQAPGQPASEGAPRYANVSRERPFGRGVGLRSDEPATNVAGAKPMPVQSEVAEAKADMILRAIRHGHANDLAAITRSPHRSYNRSP